MGSKHGWGFALLAVGLLLACSGQRRLVETTKPSSLVERFHFGEHEAHWTIQTGAPPRPDRCVDVVSGERFCLGRAGEIWRDAAPYATRLGQWAPEELTELWAVDGTLRALGESGTVYVFDRDYQTLGRALSPKERWKKTIRVGARLLALDHHGTLHGSADHGASWQPETGSNRAFIDVAADRSGRVALLAVPEQLFQSTDEGQSLNPLSRAPIGVTALGKDVDGTLRAYSVWSEPLRLFPETARLTPETSPTTLKYPIAEYSSARDYLELRVLESANDTRVFRKRGRGWVSYRGAMGEPLEGPTPVQGLDCAELRVISTAKTVLAVCSSSSNIEQSSRLTLWVSRDRGRSFAPVSASLSGALKRVIGLGRTQGDDFLLSGICADRPGTSRAKGTDCLPHGVYRIALESGGDARGPTVARLEPLPLVPLVGPAEAMAATASGSRIAIVAVPAKLRTPTVFIATGDTAHFTSFPLVFSKTERLSRSGREPLRQLFSSPLAKSVTKVESLTLAEDGTISLVLKTGDRPTLMTLDEDGSPRVVAMAPVGVSQLGASSEGALAVSISESRIYETTDQGAEFLPIATLSGRKICADGGPCAVVCRGNTCVIGDGLSRRGFGKRPALRAPFTLPVDSKRESTPAQGGFACRLDGAGWQELAGEGPLPNALTAGFPETLFYWLGRTRDGKDATLARFQRKNGTLERKALFGPAPSDQPSAVSWWRTVDGWVAARMRAVAPPGEPIGAVDFRWENLTRSTVERARVKFTEPLGAQVTRTASGYVFAPAALALVGRDLVVELGGGKPKPSVDAYLVTPRGAAERLSFTRWPRDGFEGLDYLRLPEGIARVGFHKDGSVVFVAPPAMKPAFAMTVAVPGESSLRGMPRFGYVGERSGVFLPGKLGGFLALSGAMAEGIAPNPIRHLAPLREQLPCRDAQRQGASRYLSTEIPEKQRLLRVELGDGSAEWLHVGRAVVYEKDESACWELLEAQDRDRNDSALLFGEGEGKAWLFRQTKDPVTGASMLYSKLICERNEALSIPVETAIPASTFEP